MPVTGRNVSECPNDVKPPPSLDTLSRLQDAPKAVRRIPAWLIPVGIAAGFALLFLALFRDRILPAPDVKVAAVLATSGGRETKAATTEAPAEGNMLFQASGWIEPDPLPIKAGALIDGVVDIVHVLEGGDVKKGDVLASLIQDDVRLALATAEQNRRTLTSTRKAHQAAIASARKKLEGAKAQETAASTMLDEAADRAKRLDGLPDGAVSESDIVSARLRREREESQVLTATLFTGELQAEIERMEFETQVKDDEIRTAEIEVEKAQLAFDRTKITAPADGRVLRLLAAPGQKKMLQDNDPESSTIAILYQPSKLQVRVDVPLADAAGLQIGQKARIRCSLLPDKVFNGTVTRITGEADLQRNTLQAKVSISDPVDQLRPEMLCRVEFLGTAGTSIAGIGATAGSLVTWIPEAAASDGGVWVCDPESKRVSKRPAKIASETRDGFTRVDEGLRPGEWVILSPQDLRDGQRVNPTLTEP